VAGFIHVIQQYHNHRLIAREEEYRYCVRQNLANPHIYRVHNLVHAETAVPDELRTHPKYVESTHESSWLSFRDALAYANDRLAGEVVAISNLDIFLDHQSDWPSAVDLLRNGVVLGLSRTDIDGLGNAFKDPAFERMAFANSQDTWLFRSPFVVPDCDFDIGTLGCDNAFAERIRRAGRVPVNSPNRFRILHYDVARGKHAGNQLAIHAQHRGDRGNPHPEESGQYLLPDIDQVGSLDKLASALGLTELQRYQMACDMMSRFIQIRNR